MENLKEHYINKLDTDRRMNIFLKYFELPQPTIIFILITAMFLAVVEILTHIWVPSVLAVYLMWESLINLSTKYEIAEKCVVEDTFMEWEFQNNNEEMMANFPDDEMCVTEEDRDSFVFTHVCYYRNMGLIDKIKKHYKELFFIMVLYLIILSFFAFVLRNI
ncbi:MAG: hypothetical protein HYU68_00485 [Bacteroidetes bacterium]|nr:hypothetical protein [Bacteroidota bacterium]